MTRYIFLIFILAFAGLQTCDDVDEPYGNEVEIDQPTELTRKAIIFEFTGIHCTNCPEGHEAIEEIDSVYHGHVIPISVHAGFFAQPHSDDEPDFRTPFGNQLYQSLAEPPTPAASICSINADDAIVGATTSWQGVVGNFIPDYTKFVIEPSFMLNESQLESQFVITEREAVDNNLLFYVFIIENHIEGPQAGTEEDPYDHMHVLRKCISSINGAQVKFSEGNAVLEFEAQLDSSWKIDNLYLVGIIVDQETKEIYSGEQISLKQ